VKIRAGSYFLILTIITALAAIILSLRMEYFSSKLLPLMVSGTMLSIALFAFSYLKSQGARWVTAIAFAIITTVLCYVPFELILGFELYRGLVFIQLFRSW